MKFYPSGKLPLIPHMYFIYGDGGTGKTSLFRLFPGRKLLFSFDLSTNVIRPEDNIDVMILEENDLPSVQNLIMDTLQGAVLTKQYSAIALDDVTVLQNAVLDNIDSASKDGRQNYQKMQLWFWQLGSWLRNCGLTVFVTAHQLDNGASLLEGRYQADMNDKAFISFTGMFDLVGRIYKKKGQRWIELDSELGNHAKNKIDDRTLIHAEELIQSKKAGK